MVGRFIKGITHGYPLTLKYYSEDWHKKSCITQGHKLNLKQLCSIRNMSVVLLRYFYKIMSILNLTLEIRMV